MAPKKKPGPGEILGAIAFVAGLMLVAAGEIDQDTGGDRTKTYVGALIAIVGVVLLIMLRRRRA